MPEVEPNTLEALKAQLPDELAILVDKYGVAFINMTAEQIWSWLDQSMGSSPEMAYAAILSRLDNQALLNEWNATINKWSSANQANAAKVAYQKEILHSILMALVQMATAALVTK